MKKQTRKTTTLRLEEADIQAILNIRRHYGIASDNQAMIFALRDTANRIEQERRFHPVP